MNSQFHFKFIAIRVIGQKELKKTQNQVKFILQICKPKAGTSGKWQKT